MSEEIKVTPKLFLCTAPGCDFSLGNVGVDKDGKARLVVVTTRKGNEKTALQSPPYGVISAMPGKVAICPVCGATMTVEEDGRHKFLRLNSQRITAVREKMRLIGNTMKGAQYAPNADDLAHVQKVLYATFDVVADLIDKRAEKLANPEGTSRKGRKAGTVKVKIPFSL